MSEKGPQFDGVYNLKDDLPNEKPHELCSDNCLYYKLEEPDELFCFQQVELSEGANIACEVENTNTASTIQTTSNNLQIQVQQLNNTITEKKSLKAKLIENKEIAKNASKAVDEINQSLQTLQKHKRQTGNTINFLTYLLQSLTHLKCQARINFCMSTEV